MADLLAINDVLEVRFVCKAPTQYAFNVRHFRVTAIGGGQPTLDTAVLAMSAKFGPLYKACMSSTATFYGCDVRRLLPSLSLAVQTKTGSGAGTVAGDLMSTQTAGVISLRTNLPGKKFRGRMYIPFPGETDNDVNARPVAALLSNYAALLLPHTQNTTYNNGADNFSAVGVIYHRSVKTETTIVSGFVRLDWGTQRRRSSINRPDRAPF
jgi:hypothetical protein